MCVHHIQRHLNGVELEAMLRSRGQHLQMDVWTFVSGEADEADLACLFGFQYGLHSTAVGENPIWIGVANHFVKLEQVNSIGLQSPQ